ncbi:hypothetical protein L8P92_04535 [Enterobacter asburiae]|uniref:hypothetical protein n=1 Tax=Enterobacter asburiae TaxID=61645 RepID=UPI002003EDF9|nr:hypothetical protein [Enterobacter asburiae]MCK7061189.1 hypothetical protein [Enterobacter asburiae]MCK7284700.1 hypothetical protein [Enterobacter asburiae]
MAPKTKNTQKDDTATDTNAEPAVTTSAATDNSAPAPDVNADTAGEAGSDGDGTESGSDAKQDETPEERMSKLTGKVAAVQNGRVAVMFLGPFSRYSRGDVACFDSAVAQDMVDRNIAVWAKDAERALQPNKDDDAHDTDIG